MGAAFLTADEIYAIDKISKVDLPDYITIKEAAEKWGVSTRAITYHVVAGRIPGVIKKASVWLIPVDAQKPADGRKNNRRQPKKADMNEGG